MTVDGEIAMGSVCALTDGISISAEELPQDLVAAILDGALTAEAARAQVRQAWGQLLLPRGRRVVHAPDGGPWLGAPASHTRSNW